jgi:hypothetical protein
LQKDRSAERESTVAPVYIPATEAKLFTEREICRKGICRKGICRKRNLQKGDLQKGNLQEEKLAVVPICCSVAVTETETALRTVSVTEAKLFTNPLYADSLFYNSLSANSLPVDFSFCRFPFCKKLRLWNGPSAVLSGLSWSTSRALPSRGLLQRATAETQSRT